MDDPTIRQNFSEASIANVSPKNVTGRLICNVLKPLQSNMLIGTSSKIRKASTVMTDIEFSIESQNPIGMTNVVDQNSIGVPDSIEKHNSPTDLMNLLKTADDNNTYDEDEMKFLLSMIQQCNESSTEPSTEEPIECIDASETTDDERIIKEKLTYTFKEQFSIPQDHWDALHKGKQLDADYAQYFMGHLNSNLGVSCVLKSRGPWYSYQLFNMRFACTNKPCKVEYKVCQIDGPNFKLHKSGVEDHQRKRAPQVRGINRQIVSKGLSQMHPAKYLMFCQKGINKTLLEKGHLQDFISTTTAETIRNVALQTLDYDKDDIIDILKMKILADTEFKKNGSPSDVFIRRITLDPFIVLMYSNAQLKLIKDLSVEEPDLTLHLDATGNVGRHSAKRIYYYAGVVRTKMNPKDEDEPARLQPALEFVSGEHDSFNIRLQLEEYMKDYQVKYPNRKWPFKYTVTDFSFALLNAVCRGWNGIKLITYINLSYLVAGKQINLDNFLEDFDIMTFLQLCCGHFSKTFSNDVSKYYPNMHTENQKILKEIFAEMIDTNDLNTLRTIWINLSTLFRSKYANNDTQEALKNLVNLMVPKKKPTETEEEEQEEQTEETRLPDDTHECETMYGKSRYYQDFVKVFEAEVKPQNSFYNVEFSTMFLKKYVSILPLWTSIIVKSRKSSGPVESHFKDSKKRLAHKEPEIGALPLKCGRLCRELEQHTKYITSVCAIKVPRKNNCYEQSNKRKRDNDDDELRAKKFKETDKILSLYKYAPKAKTPKTPKNARTPKAPKVSTVLSTDQDITTLTPTIKKQQTPITTSTSAIKNPQTPTGSKITPRMHRLDFDLQIDDEKAEEEWYRQLGNKHSHKDKATLKKLQNSNEDPTFKNILEKTPKTNNKINKTAKSKTGLIDHPESYIIPTRNFVVSRISNVLLHKEDYETLFGTARIDHRLLDYMASLFNAKANKLQMETTDVILKIINNCSQNPIPKIKKSIVVGMMLNGLVIIDCEKKLFSYIDPKDNSDQMEYFNNFVQFLVTHNKIHSKLKISPDGWTYKSFNHQPNDDSALFIINYVTQYLDTERMDATIAIDNFRIELQHTILWKSTSMKNRCVICGLATLSQDESTTWVECNNCKRWTHVDCVSNFADVSDVSNEHINFFCVICKANTPE